VKHYLFTLPPTSLSTPQINSEQDLQSFGIQLYNEDSLSVLLPTDVRSKDDNTASPRNTASAAYRYMTFLDGTPDIDDTPSLAEERLYKRIEELVKEQSDTLKDIWCEVTCFSSMTLLANILRASNLRLPNQKFKAAVSADGTSGTASGSFMLLTFGVFSVNQHGKRSFQPVIFIISPSESELFSQLEW